MRGILRPLQYSKEFETLVRGIEKKLDQQVVFGLSGSQLSYLFAGLTEKTAPLPVLAAVPGEREAGILVDELSALMPGIPVRLFPVWQLLPYQVLAQSKEVMARRLHVLESLAKGEHVVIVAPAEALLRRLVPPDDFCSAAFRLAVGDRVDMEKLLRRLPVLGFERADMVEERGQFGLRGGILDVFPMTAHRPARLEFFDWPH